MSSNARMHVVVVASQKGGAGKSTLAMHLAAAADVRTVLLDMDPQQTLARWWQSREADTPALAQTTIGQLSTKLEALGVEGYELCVIDTPPAVSASIAAVIASADLVLIPVRPSPADLWAVGATIEIARKAEKPFAFVLSQATRGATLVTQAMAALSEHGRVAGVVHSRVGFAGVLADGRTIMDHEPKGQAAKEIEALWAYVAERMGDSKKARNPVKSKPRKVVAGKVVANG